MADSACLCQDDDDDDETMSEDDDEEDEEDSGDEEWEDGEISAGPMAGTLKSRLLACMSIEMVAPPARWGRRRMSSAAQVSQCANAKDVMTGEGLGVLQATVHPAAGWCECVSV